MEISNNLRAEYIKMDGKFKNYDKLMAEYIKASEKLRIEIITEKDPFIMLDKSLLCISLMTGDKVFYETSRKRIIDIICKWNKKC